ncbi:MAG: LPXTG cell wall anchor domain-containing protein [Chloroflexi bacterium]|nr:LPXTG cell wall anchor domain-containing protein [Chloroflexota bacterium]
MFSLHLRAHRALVILAIIALAFFLSAQFDTGLALADSVIAEDDFEDGDDGGTGLWEEDWEFEGDADISKKGGPHSGKRHLRLRRDTGRAERPADLRGETNIHLRFWAKADSFEEGETARVEISPDGDEWTVLFTWTEEDADTQYRFHDFEIADGILTEEFFVAFDAGMSGGNDRLYIDDLQWVAVDAAEPEPTPIPTQTPAPPTPTPTATATPVPATAAPELAATATEVPEDDEEDEFEPLPAPTPTLTPTPVPLLLPAPDPDFPPAPVRDITLDGEFEDWNGMPNVADIADDASKSRGDLYRLFWANDVNGTTVFWQVERYGSDGLPFGELDLTNEQTKKVKYTVFIDANNNGDFDDNIDRHVRVSYDPGPSDSKVTVDVRPAQGGNWENIAKNQDYGDSEGEGGHRVEFAVSWSDLGISFGQPIRMIVESDRDDRLPNTGDIQWSPASILGLPVLIVLFLAGVIVIWWFKGRHVWHSG